MDLISVQSVRVSSFEPSPIGNNGSTLYSVGEQRKTKTTKILVCYSPLYCEIHYEWTNDEGQLVKVVKRYAGLPFISSERL